jgi:RNA polymerase sigma-70 factor (ECF subfamily)
MQVMAPDVILVADGGGLVPAARVPIHGSEVIAELLTRKDRETAGFETSTVWLNGALAGRLERDGRLVVVSLVVEDGRVTRIYVVANPEKLTRLGELAELVR